MPRWLRRRSVWAAAGAAIGAAFGIVVFAPAAWLARAVADASEGRLLLADARGTVWNGSATIVLLGGEGTTSASALPGRLEWRLRPSGPAEFEFRAKQACCLVGEQRVRFTPGPDALRIQMLPPRGAPEADALQPVGQLPLSVLSGFGAPWNSLRLGGVMRLTARGLAMSSVQGRVSLAGRADLLLDGLSSAASLLPALGDYRLAIDAQPQAAGTATLTLSTLRGPLQLQGSGQFGAASALRFRGQARAEPGSEAALNNLLNVIGRREGPISHLSIG